MKLGIVGYGVVGRALERLLTANASPWRPPLAVYDLNQAEFNTSAHCDAINQCDLVFVCVSTPERADGRCDVSAVEQVVGWVEAPLCVKSTVPPGTTHRLTMTQCKKVAFSPEYIGETEWHPWKHSDNKGFLIVGGDPFACGLVVSAYQEVLGPELRVFLTDSTTAELCKYMANTFLAMKVAFVNQFYDLALAWRVDFNELRELWLADPRIGRSHTMVTEERGFGGRCFPKDMAAIIQAARAVGGAPLLEAIDAFNDEVVRQGKAERAEKARTSCGS